MVTLWRTLRLFAAVLLIGIMAVACADDDEDEIVGDREVSTEELVDIGDNLQEEEEQEGDLPGAPEEELETTEVEDAGTGSPGAIEGATTATVADILDDPQQFEEMPVVVDGAVSQLIADGAFIVASEEGAEEGLLVAGAGDAFPGLEEGSTVSIVGMVTAFDVNDAVLDALIEQGEAKNLDAVLAEYEDQPYLAASHVLFSDVSTRDLIVDGEAFVGETVTVTGPIVELSEESAFLMGFPIDGENLLVIDAETERENDLELNDLVTVRGTVREADP